MRLPLQTMLLSVIAFSVGGIVTTLVYEYIGVTWKSRVKLHIPNYLSEPHVSDNSSSLKNEIARLTREKTRLQDVLGDLRNILTQQHNRAAHDGLTGKMKLNISRVISEASEFPREHDHYDDFTVADQLYNSTRILCWVMTQPSNLDKRAIHIKRTWGKRCNKLLFFSSVGNDSFPVIGLGTNEGREYLTVKTFRAFRYVYKHYYDDFDWFMRTDDDSYVIMENLRYFLSMQDTNKAVHFGHKFKVIVRSGYFAGGPGVIFSKEALKRFSSAEGVKLCPEADKGVDDVNIGRCMEHLREHISHYANWTMFKSIRTPLLHSKIRVYKDVEVGDTLDSEGRTRFHCFEPYFHVMGSYPDWFYKYDANQAKSGISSISDYAIGFHYTSPQVIYLLEYLVYHLRPYGVRFADLDLNKRLS